jgi:hypothetical protein
VAGAYSLEETYQIRFSGRNEHLQWCSFEYWPGGEPRVSAIVHGPPEEVEAMIAPVIAAFPLQRTVLFISWSGPQGKHVARVLKKVIAPKLPPAGEVFFSPEMAPGTNPLTEMLDHNLLQANAHIVLVTPPAARSPWVTWETAASWAWGKSVIPIFVGTEATDIGSPLRHLVQGVQLDDARGMERAIGEALSAVSAEARGSLSAVEHEALRQAAQDPSGGGGLAT